MAKDTQEGFLTAGITEGIETSDRFKNGGARIPWDAQECNLEFTDTTLD